MKNKDKFNLSKVTFFDSLVDGTVYITVLNENKVVGKFPKTEDTYIDTVFKWLEKEFQEYSPEVAVAARKTKKKIELPPIDFDVNKINQMIEESSEKAKKKARRERRKAKKEKTSDK